MAKITVEELFYGDKYGIMGEVVKQVFARQDECKDEFRAHVEKRLKYFPDAITADKEADIIGYAKGTAYAYIQQKRLFAVRISGKYIIPKSALAEFLVTDFAFEIVHESTWHMNTILLFTEKE